MTLTKIYYSLINKLESSEEDNLEKIAQARDLIADIELEYYELEMGNKKDADKMIEELNHFINKQTMK